MLLVVSKLHLAYDHTALQSSWKKQSGLNFGLALMGCQGLWAQLQIVLLFRSSFPLKYVRAWSVS